MDTERTNDLPEWSGERYADNTAHHRAFDTRYLAPLRLNGAERILDVGCGSGDLTATLATLVPDGEVVGVDPQPTMLDEAAALAHPNQRFALVAAQDIATAFDPGSFDVVVSRATLHWVSASDHPGVIAAMFAVLRPGGQLRLEFGGAGNIASARRVLNPISEAVGGPVDPWNFPDAGVVHDTLLEVGFRVEDNAVLTVSQRRPFDRDGALGWYESQIEMAYDHSMDVDTTERFRAEVRSRFDEFARPDGSFDQTYVRLEAYATKPV